jgi:hypothetical protein
MKDYSSNARLALDTLAQRPTVGIPNCGTHFMEHSVLERIAGTPAGSYRRHPYEVYKRMQLNAGTCMIDQYIPENPLSMGDKGYESGSYSATTGLDVTLDGITIDSPEAVAEHLERFEIPRIKKQIKTFNGDEVKQKITVEMSKQKELLGDTILSTGYGHISFPHLMYYKYGYVPFLQSYALFPELWEQVFMNQGEYAALHNKAAVEIYIENEYPLYQRLDHDMADSRSTLVSIQSLEKIWFPHFIISIKPALDAGFKLIWHCDGNLSAMLPLLLEAGLVGFQGFQYEDGMDYEKICAMRTRDGGELLIWAGVSVTRTLPKGNTTDVARELKYLVEKGPKTGLFLGCSSSCLPGTPWENIKTLIEGLQYYRINGRAGLL